MTPHDSPPPSRADNQWNRSVLAAAQLNSMNQRSTFGRSRAVQISLVALLALGVWLVIAL